MTTDEQQKLNADNATAGTVKHGQLNRLWLGLLLNSTHEKPACMDCIIRLNKSKWTTLVRTFKFT